MCIQSLDTGRTWPWPRCKCSLMRNGVQYFLGGPGPGPGATAGGRGTGERAPRKPASRQRNTPGPKAGKSRRRGALSVPKVKKRHRRAGVIICQLVHMSPARRSAPFKTFLGGRGAEYAHCHAAALHMLGRGPLPHPARRRYASKGGAQKIDDRRQVLPRRMDPAEHAGPRAFTPINNKALLARRHAGTSCTKGKEGPNLKRRSSIRMTDPGKTWTGDGGRQILSGPCLKWGREGREAGLCRQQAVP